MSVIADALKTAQREKTQRESQAVPQAMAPLLVPLRSKPAGGLDRRRVVLFSIAGLGVVGAATVLAIQLRPERPALPAAPPVTSAILSEALAADSASRLVNVPPSATRPAERDPSRAVVPAQSRRDARTTTPAVAQTAPRTVSFDTTTVLQGQPRGGDAGATGASPIRISAGDPRQAGRLRIAVERAPESEAARLFGRAVAAHRAGDLATARSLYERVIALAPGDADALNNLGVLLSSQREFPRAIDLLRRAASIAPNNAGTWNNIGTILREQGRSSDAIAAFRHALTIDPRHVGARVGLAQQYLAIGSLPEARDLLEQVVAAQPSHPEAQYTLGQVLELRGDRPGAIRAYTAFIRVAPPRLAAYVDAVRKHVDELSARSR